VQKSANIQYMECLDQLRAVAVLMVFFAHCLHNFTRGMDRTIGTWLFPDNPFLAVIAEGHCGVALFMVLSGFLFAYGAYQKEIIYVEFIRNRLLRIYPMYVLMLFLGAYTYPQNYSFLGFVTSLFLFSNTPGALNGGMFTILLWTISAEFIFYLLFPYFHKMYSNTGAFFLIRLLVLAILIRVICVELGASPRDLSYFTILGRMDQFIFGMLAAYLLAKNKLKFWSGNLQLAISIVIVIASLYALNSVGGGWVSESRWKILWPTWEGIIFAAMAVAFIQGRERSSSGFIGGMFTFVGSISFSIYLLHQSVISVAQRANLRVVNCFGLYLDALLTGIGVLVAVVVLSWLTFTLIERPFMGMRRRYLLIQKSRNP
jgi:peptidoglycan/LPS O-acetylase OafA/YrhL